MAPTCRRGGDLPLKRMLVWVPASAAIACGLVVLFSLAERPLNLAVSLGYCLIIGALVATALVRLLNPNAHATYPLFRPTAFGGG
jgi:hypothetical protein